MKKLLTVAAVGILLLSANNAFSAATGNNTRFKCPSSGCPISDSADDARSLQMDAKNNDQLKTVAIRQ